jgi:hypothetical protein
MIIKYIKNIFIGLDQFVNAILGGDPDETISSRIGKRIRSNKATPFERYIAHVLDNIDKNHCNDAIEEDEGDDEIWK